MMDSQVILLVGPIRSGKTTTLRKWTKNTSNVVGYLSPDIEGKRVFEEIGSGNKLPMQVKDGDLIIGKYTFDSTSFDYIKNKILKTCRNKNVDYIVIDEIGPLEIKKNLGFHDLLLQLQSNNHLKKTNLILVVRNNCIKPFLAKYKFKNVKVVSIDNINNSMFKTS
ncbi:MAG: hypothetical protein HKN40_01730 [Winogradskyella sp.]|uniref:nucleoside-triphosphatase n=1 Tax=Winogradskyella sp. TaxID=1883156 RepID=UPI0017B160DF|nr:hypothetical protein [Winogradskyella sp.]